MTATSGAVLTAAQWNSNVRDNLNETAVAKATTANSIFVATGANALAERIPGGNTVLTSQSTTSTSYTDLATAGPSYTVTTGTTATVLWFVKMDNTTNGSVSKCSVAVSGATTTAASDNYAAWCEHDSSNLDSLTFMGMNRFTLTAGSNTFTMKYAVGANTGNFSNRQIMVFPF
jgi:hypothetical protein